MRHLVQVVNDLRSAADALEPLIGTCGLTAETRRETASIVEGARRALKTLDHDGLEPDDFDLDSPHRPVARVVADGRRILSNALSIAVQSMFSGPDPGALTRDMVRAVKGMRRHADAEEDLLMRTGAGEQVA